MGWILAFCLCGALATQIIEDETSLRMKPYKKEPCYKLCASLYAMKGWSKPLKKCTKSCNKQVENGTDLDNYQMAKELCDMRANKKKACLCHDRLEQLKNPDVKIRSNCA